MDAFDSFRMIIAWAIASISALWLASCVMVGAQTTSKTYLADGSAELAVIMIFLAVMGLFAPKITKERILREVQENENKEALKKYFGN